MLLLCGWPATVAAADQRPAQSVLPLQLQAMGLSPAEIEASARLVAAVEQRLPPRWRQALQQPIALEWRDDLPPEVQGRARLGRIRLDRTLLRDWQRLATPLDPEQPAAHAAMAALIHELAHQLDRSAAGGFSRDGRLLDLAGWQVRPWHAGRGRNRFSDRSPDRYELQNPREFVAVNLEHFVLDPDYRCRRPALWTWFTERLGSLTPPRDCGAALAFMQADSEAGDVSLLRLDPARVWQVDYLLAEGNDQMASRWGHSMLRLVICAPGRVPGPQCRLDLQYHRVLSFRAFVGDVQLSGWRGLTGSYPSRLFLLPLTQVLDEYTKVELRALSSLPLALQREEIAALLERAARLHWNYDGRYYFIGNNCAVETWKLLHDGVPRLAQLPLSGVTPTGLRRRLLRSGLGDERVLVDHAEAVRLGYFFPSAQAQYQAMFTLLRNALPLPQRTVAQWLQASPLQRRRWLADADLRGSAALLLLEQAAQRQQELHVRDWLKRRLLAADDAAMGAASGVLRDLLDQAGTLARPAALLEQPGYGLPQQAELDAAASAAVARGHRLRRDWDTLRTSSRAGLPQEQRELLAQIDANLVLIGQRLRMLNQETGDTAALPR